MNFQQTKIILEKINRLTASMALDEDNISQIEKDLMLSYVKQLYETCLAGQTEVAKPARPTGVPKERVVESAPKVEEVQRVQPVVEAQVERVVAPEPTPAPKVIREEMPVVEKPAVVSKPVEMEAEVPKYDPAPYTPPKIAVPKIVTTPNPVVEQKMEPINNDLEGLFEQKEASDLAEKLSQTPIRDLTRAMSINDRLLTIKELFNGDDTAFQATLVTLNGLNNFAEAKEYLARNIAGKYDWPNPAKEKKAKIFIKLVRRRYY